ncbi:MAG: NrfD/PsrC family molybdoenzyme membrane anchor subunit [Acidobacteriota bacterium]
MKDRDEEILLSPIVRTGKKFYLFIFFLAVLVFIGYFGWAYQLKYGLGVTGLNRPVFWGLYITNFVFFIGISHSGTLISAILRISKSEWRRAITRSAEVITVIVLYIGTFNIILDLGRPDRAWNVIKNGVFEGRIYSPLLWDVFAIATYIIASTVYLYLPLIPDIAIMRDRISKRKWFYRILSLGWNGNDKQKRRLEVAISIMAVLVIPIAVSVHTVVSWVFAMTIQPMWHSTIFGPYFVVGAIFSGIAAIIIAMAILRKVYHLEEYIKAIHFNNLGILLLVMVLLWFYFTFAEYLTTFYGNEPMEMAVFYSRLIGKYAPYFWIMVISNFIVPFIILSNKKTRTISGTVIASISVVLGMWLERFTIVVPTLVNPRLPYEQGIYIPTWVELFLMIGCFAWFILFYVIFSKLFPIVSIWEVKEGREKMLEEAGERMKDYLPGPSGGVKSKKDLMQK